MSLRLPVQVEHLVFNGMWIKDCLRLSGYSFSNIILSVWEMVSLYFYSTTFFIVMFLKSLRSFHFWSDRDDLINFSDVGWFQSWLQSSSWCAQESKSQMAVLRAATGIAVLGCLSRSVVHHIVNGVLNGLQAGSGSLRCLLSVLSFPQGNRNDYMNRKYSLSGQMLHPFAQLVLVLISCFIPVRSSGMKVKPFFFHAISLSCCVGRDGQG